jgi:hypothetical protein
MKTVTRHALELEVLLSESADRATIAREQSALFPTRLALACLTSGAGLSYLHDAAGAHAPLRARWLAEAQRNYQAWLENGGFTQYDVLSGQPLAAEPLVVEPLVVEPLAAEPPAPSTDAQQDNACID